jgi:hypothetical protein
MAARFYQDVRERSTAFAEETRVPEKVVPSKATVSIRPRPHDRGKL